MAEREKEKCADWYLFTESSERNVRITKLKIQFRRHFVEANNYVTPGCVEGERRIYVDLKNLPPVSAASKDIPRKRAKWYFCQSGLRGTCKLKYSTEINIVLPSHPIIRLRSQPLFAFIFQSLLSAFSLIFGSSNGRNLSTHVSVVRRVLWTFADDW